MIKSIKAGAMNLPDPPSHGKYWVTYALCKVFVWIRSKLRNTDKNKTLSVPFGKVSRIVLLDFLLTQKLTHRAIKRFCTQTKHNASQLSSNETGQEGYSSHWTRWEKYVWKGPLTGKICSVWLACYCDPLLLLVCVHVIVFSLVSYRDAHNRVTQEGLCKPL